MREIENQIKGLPPSFQYKDFSNFAVISDSPTVGEARKSALWLCEGKNYRKRIVLLTGGENSGKTHLAIAIAKHAGEALEYSLNCLFVPAIEFFINVGESRGKVDYIESLANNNSVLILDNYNATSITEQKYIYLLTEKAKHRFRMVIITSQQTREELMKDRDLIVKNITDIIPLSYQMGIENVIRDLNREEAKKRDALKAEERLRPKFATFNTFGKPFVVNLNDPHPDCPKYGMSDPYWLEMTALYQGSLLEQHLAEGSWVKAFREFRPMGQTLSEVLAYTVKKIGYQEVA